MCVSAYVEDVIAKRGQSMKRNGCTAYLRYFKNGEMFSSLWKLAGITTIIK